MNPAFGRGFGGRGRGGGRGRRNRFGGAGWPISGTPQGLAAPTRDQELGALKAQAEQFEGVLGEIRKRIEALEASSKPE
jgi:hypothetical protein